MASLLTICALHWQNTSKVARGNEPETIYMVTSGTHMNGGCCFDCERGATLPVAFPHR